VDYRNLTNVLGVLRLVNAIGPNRTGVQLLAEMAKNSGMVAGDAALMEMARQILQEIEQAHAAIVNSGMDPESRHGVEKALERLRSAFALAGVTSQLGTKVGDVAGAISNFTILLRGSGIEPNANTPPEAVELAEELEKLMQAFNEAGVDPAIKELCKQHLQVLATMLRHLPIFGLDAAMTTYFELLLKLKRAETQGTPEQKKAIKPLSAKIDGLKKNLMALDAIWNVGSALLTHGKTGAQLLGLLPPS
jgi:hypothetical protein